MLGRSVTFRPESVEKLSQRGTLKNLTTPTVDIIGSRHHLNIKGIFKVTQSDL